MERDTEYIALNNLNQIYKQPKTTKGLKTKQPKTTKGLKTKQPKTTKGYGEREFYILREFLRGNEISA